MQSSKGFSLTLWDICFRKYNIKVHFGKCWDIFTCAWYSTPRNIHFYTALLICCCAIYSGFVPSPWSVKEPSGTTLTDCCQGAPFQGHYFSSAGLTEEGNCVCVTVSCCARTLSCVQRPRSVFASWLCWMSVSLAYFSKSSCGRLETKVNLCY